MADDMSLCTDPVAHVEVERRSVVGGVGEAGQRAAGVGRRLGAQEGVRRRSAPATALELQVRPCSLGFGPYLPRVFQNSKLVLVL